MKSLYVSILLIIFSSISYSQTKSINCIIFIDGKLPDLSVIQGYFSYIDSTQKKTKVDFEYEIGDMKLTQQNCLFINTLNPEDEITINLTYKENNGPRFNYSGVLKVGWLDYRYLVIRITNLNKKTGKYYFGYSTPDVIKPFIKQEYNMFEKYKEYAVYISMICYHFEFLSPYSP